MTDGWKKQGDPDGRGAGPRRRRWVAVLIGVLLACVAPAAYFWYPARAPAPPLPDLAGADPAVTAAVTAAREKVLASPRSSGAWGTFGMVLAAHRFADEASAAFAEAERLDPREARWPYHQGLLCKDAGRPGDALPRLRRAIELCDSTPDAPRLKLAELLLGEGQNGEAAAQLRKLLEKDAAHPLAHLGLGQIAADGGDPGAAAAHARAAESSPYTRKAARRLLAQIHERRGERAAAEEDQRRLASLPEDAPWPDPFAAEVTQLQVGETASRRRAEQLLADGRAGEAAALLRETLQAYPHSGPCWQSLGRALYDSHQWPAAEGAFHRALELTPGDAETHVYLGMLATGRGDTAGAVAAFREGARLKPDYLPAYYNLALALQENDPAGAIEALRHALRCKPQEARAHALLGRLLAGQGKTGAALTHLRYAVELNPGDGASRQLLEKLAH